jgi:hypothetical protein
MKKLIVSNLKEFFESGSFMPFSTLAELERIVIERSDLLPIISIDNHSFSIKGMKNNDGEIVIIYSFVN